MRISQTTSPSRLIAFALGARPVLWPAIVLNAFAFAYLVKYDPFPTGLIAIDLCLIASVGFLINDVLDVAIDEANKMPRWSIKTSFDKWLFALVLSLGLVAIAASSQWISQTVFAVLLATLFLTVAYSFFLKKVFFVGNIVAAFVSVAPGFAVVIGTYSASLFGSHPSLPFVTSIWFLISGFLFILSREIRFDEFDRRGDAAGNRLTLPMVFGRGALLVMHVALGGAAVFFFSVGLVRGAHLQSPYNALSSALAAIFVILLLVIAYRSQSRTVFSRLSRLIMIVLPLAIFLSF